MLATSDVNANRAVHSISPLDASARLKLACAKYGVHLSAHKAGTVSSAPASDGGAGPSRTATVDDGGPRRASAHGPLRRSKLSGKEAGTNVSPGSDERARRLKLVCAKYGVSLP
jgi:hypothetical protein